MVRLSPHFSCATCIAQVFLGLDPRVIPLEQLGLGCVGLGLGSMGCSSHLCLGLVAWVVWCRGKGVKYPVLCSALCKQMYDPAVLEFHQRLLQALAQLLSRCKSRKLAHVVFSDAPIVLLVEVGGGLHTHFVLVTEAVSRSGRHPAQQTMDSYSAIRGSCSAVNQKSS